MKAKSVLWFEDPDKLKILKSKPKAKRPNFAKTPVAHLGGIIFSSKAKQALRVYKRTPHDKVETSVKFKSESPADKKLAYEYACALIENDPRPHK